MKGLLSMSWRGFKGGIDLGFGCMFLFMASLVMVPVIIYIWVDEKLDPDPRKAKSINQQF